MKSIGVKTQSTDNQSVKNDERLIDHFDMLLGNMSQGLIYISKNGVVTTYNAAAEILLGLEEEIILDTPFWDHFVDDFLGFSLKEALERGEAPGRCVVPFKSYLEIERTMEVSPTLISSLGDKSPVLGVMVLLRDITELLRLQNEEARSNRLKALGELASFVAHEIRNPLGGIKGFCTLLEEDLAQDTDSLRLLHKVMDGVDDLNRIVTEVLDFSRPVRLHKESVDFVTYLNDFLAMVRLDERITENISIEFFTSLKSCPLSIDTKKMQQVLLNLCINGVQALPSEGGKVTLKLEKNGNAVTLSITDTGCGIPPENIEKLFEPFYTTKPEGNGFGLSEVHKIIEASRGKINVTSKENLGTTFTVTLYHD